jgi:phage-related protein (TIGR01555 family)
MTKPTGNPRGRPRKIVQDARSVTRGDGWNNVLTNIGNRRDPVSATQFGMATMLDRRTLAAMYRGDGLAKRIVDIQVEEAIREWIEADDLLLAELGRLNAKQDVTEALKWARLFGGALVVALIDDGQDFDQPVNMNGIRSVRQLRVYDRWRVTFTTGDVDKDAMSPTFGKPLFYSVQGTTGVPYRVHSSRCWRIDGLPLPDEERQLNNGWGDSAIMAAYEALRAYGQTMGASANIVRDFVQVVLGIRGLTDMLRQGEDALVAARANVIDLTRSVANTVFLDADGETYDKKASSVAGLADLWDRFALHVSSVTGIPATKLLGRSPAGMNATGESDMRQWYDVVQAYRGDEVEPLLRWLVGLIEAQSEWTDRPEEMDWTWPSLYQPTEAEWADVKLKIAQADAVYLDRGAADPEYLYHLRYGGAFRPDAHYDFEEAAEWMAGREPQV